MLLPFDHVRRAAARMPSRTALMDDGWSLSFRELIERTDALAAAFQAIDPKPQSRVGICGHNTREHLLAFLATLAAGKTWVPLNPRNGLEELTRIIDVTEPSLIICDADCLDKINPRSATLILGQPGEGAVPGISLADLMERRRGETPVRPNLTSDDVQALKFTGGSSGPPKGCVQTYRVWHACIATMVAEFGFGKDDRNLLSAPMTHGTGTLLVPILGQGGAMVFMPRPAKPAAILDTIERHGVTTVFLPPTVIYAIMADGMEGRDLSSLRHVIVGGAAIRPDEVRRAMPLFNNALETCYGQTEAPQVATVMRAGDWRDERNLASCGRATLLTEVEIMNPDGKILPRGESGEIVIRGDLIMPGYLNMPEQTAGTIRNGWLHTGDIGIIDERGFIFIKDRIRDVIITGGFNVYPSDVEAMLGRHPAVKECVVFAVPDDKWGEAVTAAVETHKGANSGGEEMIAFVKERLDSVKAPKIVHIVDELPRSPVGKILRREAKAQFANPGKE